MNDNVTDPQTRGNDPQRIHQTIIIKRKTNGLGVAGFVMALLGLLLCWIPILGWIIWLLGLLFSLIGLFKSPRGLAIAGMIISLITFVILVAFIGLIIGAMAMAM